MDNSDLLKRVHNRMVSELLKAQGNDAPNAVILKQIIDKDQNLRKAIAELYFSLEKVNDPKLAVELLADHIAMMVDMLNQLKGGSSR